MDKHFKLTNEDVIVKLKGEKQTISLADLVNNPNDPKAEIESISHADTKTELKYTYPKIRKQTINDDGQIVFEATDEEDKNPANIIVELA